MNKVMRRVLFGLVVLAALTPSLSAYAAEVYPIVFPVDGPNSYTDTWGAARSGGRTHEGTDIMASKMTPVVAAADGVVGWQATNCCAMELVHDDGYRSWYIHLNNDTPGTDDGQGWGFAPGIVHGARVQAGQLIGYVGDSGNAESTRPHLHFELRYSNGVAFNSYHSLLAAGAPENVSFHAAAATPSGLDTIDNSSDQYVDSQRGVVLPGDFDGDGRSEVAIANGLTPGWVVSELTGESEKWSTTDAAASLDALSGDFDGDGDDDIASFSTSGTWTGFRSNGSSFAAQAWGRFGGAPWVARVVGDFDGDGDDDILSFHPPTKKWWISRLQGSSLVSRVFTSYSTASGWQTHLAADINGDGADELASFHPSNGTWWTTGLTRSTRLLYDVSTNSGWQHLTAVDRDGDGADELAMYHPSNGSWWVVDAGTSPARLSLWARFSTRTGWVNPVAADFNGDGKQDLLIRHSASGRVWALIGGSSGSLKLLGTLVSGATEGEWLIEAGGAVPGLLAVSRN